MPRFGPIKRREPPETFGVAVPEHQGLGTVYQAPPVLLRD
jgi:hypothetical protein